MLCPRNSSIDAGAFDWNTLESTADAFIPLHARRRTCWGSTWRLAKSSIPWVLRPRPPTRASITTARWVVAMNAERSLVDGSIGMLARDVRFRHYGLHVRTHRMNRLTKPFNLSARVRYGQAPLTDGRPIIINHTRQVELKHGRVAMLAALGVIVQSFVQLPDPVFQNARPQVRILDRSCVCRPSKTSLHRLFYTGSINFRSNQTPRPPSTSSWSSAPRPSCRLWRLPRSSRSPWAGRTRASRRCVCV